MADLLRRQLSVPEIYLEPKMSSNPSPDVLAVDRAGSGDLHAVEIKIMAVFPTRSMLRPLVSQVKAWPFHFKYLAMPGFLHDLSDGRRFAEYSELFDESGIGRIGIISFNPDLLQSSAAVGLNSVAMTIRPERFRVPSEKLASVERFLTKAKPDIAVRI